MKIKRTHTQCTTLPQPQLTSILLASLLFLAFGCSSSLFNRGDEENQVPTWVHATYPMKISAETRVDRYKNHIALVREGRVYGSNSDQDMPGQVMGMVAGLTLAPDGPSMLRVGQIGFGTGVSASVALSAGSRVVDVFENDGYIVAGSEALSSTNGLVFQKSIPVHPALRIVTRERAEKEPYLRYDLLISPPATSALAGPEALYSVERFNSLMALLSSNGILVHHVSAANMQPEVYRRLLRTFVHSFPYVLVLTAEPYSGDNFLIGSSNPLVFRVSNLRELRNLGGLDRMLEAAHLRHPFDLTARVLFASRQEVMEFVGGAVPITAAQGLETSEYARPPAVPAPDAPEDARRTWQEQLEEHQQQFRRMELLRNQMYSLDWPHGQICSGGPRDTPCLIHDLSDDERGANILAELSLSLMAGGRFVEAGATLETAATIAEIASVAHSERVLELLIGDPPDLLGNLPENILVDLRGALANDRCDEALEAVQSLNAESLPEERIVGAYALVRCDPESTETMERVAQFVRPLSDDETVRVQDPIVLYLSARASMILGHYEYATWTMNDFVHSHLTTASPRNPQEPIPTD